MMEPMTTTDTTPEPDRDGVTTRRVDPAARMAVLSRQRDRALEEAATWEAVAMDLQQEVAALQKVVADLQKPPEASSGE